MIDENINLPPTVWVTYPTGPLVILLPMLENDLKMIYKHFQK